MLLEDVEAYQKEGLSEVVLLKDELKCKLKNNFISEEENLRGKRKPMPFKLARKSNVVDNKRTMVEREGLEKGHLFSALLIKCVPSDQFPNPLHLSHQAIKHNAAILRHPHHKEK
ncbi:hypothetical protein STEG23_018325, partial [Scotinomys teguina]